MAEWSYVIPPDIGLTIRARRQPKLLGRCLGDEVPAMAEPALYLDLNPHAERLGGKIVRGVYKSVPWSIMFSEREDGTRVLAWKSPLLSEYLALHIALLPALRVLLLKRGIALIGGAAFEHEGATTVIAGQTGIGKTAALVGALSRGRKLIGDEYVGLSESGEVTAVVRALALRRATLDLAPRLLHRLSPARRAQLALGELARHLTLGRLDPLVHISASELRLPAASVSGAPLKTLLWLESSRAGRSGYEPLSTNDAVTNMTMMREAHDWAYGTPPSAAMDMQSWRAALERSLAGVSCYRVFVSRASESQRALEQVLLPGASPAAAGGRP